MEHDVCKVVYLDRRASEAKSWTKSHPPPGTSLNLSQDDPSEPLAFSPAQEVEETILSLLSLFPRVSVHRTSPSCLSEIRSTYENKKESSCTILLINIPSEDESSHNAPAQLVRTPSPTSVVGTDFGFFSKTELYGMDFLVHISSEIQARNLSPLILPIVLLSGSLDHTGGRDQGLNPFTNPEGIQAQRFSANEPISKVRYYDAGAADILSSPASIDRIRGLPAHAHWIKLESKRRRSSCFLPSGHSKKTSWVGTKDDKPYAQLKEAMVSELMSHICDPDHEEATYDERALHVHPNRLDIIADSFGDWSFSAHEFSDDELLYGALRMLEHILSNPALEKWKLDKDELLGFLMATRRVYNSSVLYHNFRHACDVAQATFYFLMRMGSIPSFPAGKPGLPVTQSPLAELIDPFYALTLFISALGHDVGHPGVNNGFLVAVNAPLAQLYNDRSVLESFHCAAYSQILRRYWKSAFIDRTLRSLMINVILATDMGLHRDYVVKMETLQQTFTENSNVETWNEQAKDEARELLCCLLIKCADICNVARKFEVAAQWAAILLDEFFAQGQMERDLNVPSALFGGPPDPDNLLQKCQSQIGFMSVFAYPLFHGVTKLLPSMQTTVDEIDLNKSLWQAKLISDAEEDNQRKKLAIAHERADDKDFARSDEEAGMIHELPSASILTISSSPWPAGRRASGGTPNQFVGIPPSMSREARRSSLGPTVVPDLQTSRRSSASLKLPFASAKL